MLASLRDSRLWLLILIYFCIVAANATLNFYGPSVVKELGFTNPVIIGWIMSGAFLCGAIGQMLHRPPRRPPEGAALELLAGGDRSVRPACCAQACS